MSTIETAIPVVQGVLGFMMVVAGSVKILGVDLAKKDFERYGYPEWFRFVTGGIEAFGGLGLLVVLVVGRESPSLLKSRERRFDLEFSVATNRFQTIGSLCLRIRIVTYTVSSAALKPDIRFVQEVFDDRSAASLIGVLQGPIDQRLPRDRGRPAMSSTQLPK